jgi:hypothetical protein
MSDHKGAASSYACGCCEASSLTLQGGGAYVAALWYRRVSPDAYAAGRHVVERYGRDRRRAGRLPIAIDAGSAAARHAGSVCVARLA